VKQLAVEKILAPSPGETTGVHKTPVATSAIRLAILGSRETISAILKGSTDFTRRFFLSLLISARRGI